uniref:Uncharacterized protein n=1 Tax=Davidia involucrata TaxID=16924 RepID=A0A5B7CEV5_DAVIN
MGCGASRLDAQGVAIQARLGPLLRRRIEDIRRRAHGDTLRDTTPSKKVLLVDGSEEEENSQSDLDDNARKGTGSSSSEDSLTHKHWTSNGASNKDEKSRGKVYYIEAKEEVEEELGEDEEDEEGREIGPGSPSFRIYFTDNLADDNKRESAETTGEDGSSNKKSQTGLEATGKGSVTKKVKRGRKRRSFRKVIPRGGQTAVKNLMSCYSSPDRARLLTAKTPA